MGFFDKLKNGLSKTRENFSQKVNEVFKVFRTVDEELFEELEEALITADVGVNTSMEIIERLRDTVKTKNIQEADEVKGELKSIIYDMLSSENSELNLSSKPSVRLHQ